MGIKVTIPFDDPAQHLSDPTKAIVSDGVGRLVNQFPPTEILYFNFDEDGINRSKRGEKDLEFFGTDNTGEIAEGLLRLGANLDRSAARINGIVLDTPHVLSAKMVYINRISSFTTTKEIFRVKSSTSSSMIRFYLLWQGAGMVRLSIDVVNELGAVVYTTVAAVYELIEGQEKCFGFSFTRLGSLSIFWDNAHFSTVSAATWDVKLASINITFGPELGTSIAAFDYDNVQLINEAFFTVSNAACNTEVYSKPRTFQQIITTSPFLMEELEDFQAFYRNYDSLDEFAHLLLIGAEYFFFDVDNDVWKVVRDPATDYNTAQEIRDNKDKLQISGGQGAFIQLVVLLRSMSGYSDPQITEYFIEYSMYFSLGVGPTVCAVVGSVIDDSGYPVAGARIHFAAKKDYLAGDHIACPNSQVISADNGKFVIPLVETETTGETVICSIVYSQIKADGTTEAVTKIYKNLVIPNKAGESLANIIRASLA